MFCVDMDMQDSVAILLWRKTLEFTLKKKENNKKTQTYKMLKKSQNQLEKHTTGTCT